MAYADWCAKSSQNAIQDYIEQLKRVENDKEAAIAKNRFGISEHQSNLFVREEAGIKNNIEAALEVIQNNLKEGKESVENIEKLIDKSRIRFNDSLQKVHAYLSIYWLNLILFSKCAEVSMDDEDKIFVKVERPTEAVIKALKMSMTNPLRELVDNGFAKAAFLVEEKANEEIPLNFTRRGLEAGKIVRPSKVAITREELAPKSPTPLKKSSSSMQLTDEVIFNYHPLLNAATQPRSEKAYRLQQIVKAGLLLQ